MMSEEARAEEDLVTFIGVAARLVIAFVALWILGLIAMILWMVFI